MPIPGSQELKQSRYWVGRLRQEGLHYPRPDAPTPNFTIPQQFARFEMRTSMTATDNGTGWFRVYDDATAEWVTLDDDATDGYVVITDPSGTATATGRKERGDDPAKPGDYVLCMHSDSTGSDQPNKDEWMMLASPAQGLIQFAKLQSSTITNHDGSTPLVVSVKSCDHDGANETGDAFNVQTPVDAATSRRFTDLAVGDIVGYLTDPEGVKVIVTDCWKTSMVDDGNDWVGLDTDSKLIHYTPKPSTYAEADPTKAWLTSAFCGLCFDDAGHFIGFYDGDAISANWKSPWGIANPGLSGRNF